VYSYFQRYTTGAPVPVDDFARYVREAEVSLMNSPGHRANILRPEHTHVGIGIAYNPKDGEFRVAQEFLNHYVELDALRETALPGETLVVSGRLLPGVSNPLINLAYEPVPRAMSIDELKKTSTYASPAKFTIALRAPLDSQSRFRVNVPFDRNAQPGIYHIRMFVDWKGANIQVVDALVWVGVVPVK
ncbi:MAG: CAP domain-containing protein, partial [Chloroflexi bacterium]|nr:CAP domain-containing protein [Chloroflexota bacterium]